MVIYREIVMGIVAYTTPVLLGKMWRYRETPNQIKLPSLQKHVTMLLSQD